MHSETAPAPTTSAARPPEILRDRRDGSHGIDLRQHVRSSREKHVFTRPPRIGLVIGTYGSVPHIHLHLEAWRRFYPDIPVLVHDDGSPGSGELAGLCRDYGAAFESASVRSRHQHGDLLAIIGGMIWAREEGIDLLVKMSRRFLPLTDWTAELGRLVMESQYATYSSWTRSFNFGFRTECVGFAVKVWRELGLVDHMAGKFLSGSCLLVEQFVHDLARQAAVHNCQAARAFDAAAGGGRHPDRDGYAVWDFMGYDRCERNERFLWHNSSEPEEYRETALRWGLGGAGYTFELHD